MALLFGEAGRGSVSGEAGKTTVEEASVKAVAKTSLEIFKKVIGD